MRPIASAEIIAVGSELLTASRLDTNSLAITERLRALGIVLRAKAVVWRWTRTNASATPSVSGSRAAVS
jgi:hypothetical protein